MSSWARPTEAGTLISVWVVPGAHRTEIAGVQGAALRVRVAVPAEGGRANRELVGLLRKRIGAPVDLASGSRSRHKTLLVSGAACAEVVRALDPTLPG